MSILNDATIDEMQQGAADLSQDLDDQTTYQEAQPGPGINIPQFDFSFLKTPTGSGSIESYIDHVLNPGRSRGLAQMLRGFTGFAGELNLAILDITFGCFEYMKENKAKTAAKAAQNGEGVRLYERPIINP